MKLKEKLVFFGTERFSTPFLQTLIDEGYDIVLAVTKPDAPKGRSGKPVIPPVKELAEKYSIPVVQPENPADIKSKLLETEATAGVLAAYGRIIPAEILDIFKEGIINVHPSDLPDKRGPSPIEQTILDGDNKSAVSLMKLVKELDAGPIYAKIEVRIPKNTNKPALTKLLLSAGVELLKDTLPKILAGQLKPIEQDHSNATYTKIIHKSDGDINWSKPAEAIERQVRAYQGWPGSYTQIFDVRITIHSAYVLKKHGLPGEHFISEKGLLAVYCGQDALAIDILQPAGKNPMASGDFLRGYSD